MSLPLWWAAVPSLCFLLNSALTIPVWLTCHSHPIKTQTGRSTYFQERATGSNESASSLNQICSPGNTTGVGYVYSAICGMLSFLLEVGWELPHRVSPGYIQDMKLPLPALPEPVAEALLACASQTLGILMLSPVLTFYCFLTSSEHHVGIFSSL